MSQSPEPIFLLAEDGSILNANDAAAELFSFPADKLVGRPFCETIVAQECQDSFRLCFGRIQRKVEISAVRADGREFPVEMVQKPLNGAGRYAIYLRDVSEPRKTEALLRESESRYRRIFDSNLAPIFFWDFQGNIFDANDAFLRLTGYSRKDLQEGRIRWHDLIPPDQLLLTHPAAVELQETHFSGPMDLDYIHKSGKRISTRVYVALLEDPHAGGIALALDRSSQLESSHEQKETIEKLRALLEQLPIGTFFKDKERRFQFSNTTFANTMARTPQEIAGKTGEELEFQNVELGYLADTKVLVTGEPTDMEFITRYLPTPRVIRSRKWPLRNSQGRIDGILGATEDITELRALETRLQSVEAQRSLIANAVSEMIVVHDTEGNTVFSNRSASVLGKDSEWLTPEGDPLPDSKRPDRRVLSGSRENEALIRIGDRWVIQNSMALAGSAGQLTGVVSIFRDVTELSQREELQQQQRAALSASFDAVGIFDSRGEFLYANEAHPAVFEYPPQELLGQSWRILFSPARAWIESEVLPKLRSKGRWRGELTARKRSGIEFPVEVSLSSTGTGGIAWISRDISERKRASYFQGLQQRTMEAFSRSPDLPRLEARLSKVLCPEFADHCALDFSRTSLRKTELASDSRELVVPLLSNMGNHGVLRLNRMGERGFEFREVAFAEDIAHRAALWAENQKRGQAPSPDPANLVHDLKNPISALVLHSSFVLKSLERAEDLTERERNLQVQLKQIRDTAFRLNEIANELLGSR